MKNAITLTGHVLVSDLIEALELEEVPAALTNRRDERLSFDDTEVLIDDAVDALEFADKLPARDDLEDQLDQSTVMGLAEAIRCGETAKAEQMLDLLFTGSSSYDSSIREWIDRGRFSSKARAARTVAAPKLRDAA